MSEVGSTTASTAVIPGLTKSLYKSTIIAAKLKVKQGKPRLNQAKPSFRFAYPELAELSRSHILAASIEHVVVKSGAVLWFAKLRQNIMRTFAMQKFQLQCAACIHVCVQFIWATRIKKRAFV